MSRRTLTLSLSSQIITQAKIIAAQRNTSISRLFTRSIEELAARDAAYRTACAKALRQLEKGFALGAGKIRREDLHERAGLR